MCRGNYFTMLILLFLGINMPIKSQLTNTNCQDAAGFLYSMDISTQPQQSIIALEESLELLLQNDCQEIYAASIAGLSAAHFYLKNYIKAREYAQQAVDLAKKCCPESSIYASAIANHSNFVQGQASIELKLKSLELVEAINDDLLSIVYALEDLGYAYHQQGDFEAAINYYHLAIEKLKSHEKDSGHELARILEQRGRVYLSQSKYATALIDLKKCLELLESLPEVPFYLQTKWYALKQIAEISLVQEKNEIALDYTLQLISLQQNKLIIDEYQSYLTLGDIYQSMGKYDEAIAQYKRAFSSSKLEFKDFVYHEALGFPHVKIARLYLQRKNYSKALEHFNHALQFMAIDFNPKSFNDNPTVAQIINPFATIEMVFGKANALKGKYEETAVINDLKASHESNLLVLLLIREIREQYLSEGAKHNILEKTQPIYVAAIQTAIKLQQLTSDEKYINDAFFIAENNKAVVLYEELKNRSAMKVSGISEEMLAVEQQLQEEIAFLKTSLLEKRQMRTVDQQEENWSAEQKIMSLQKEMQFHLREMEKNNPLYGQLKKQTKTVQLPKVIASLKNENIALVEFMIHQREGLVFFVTADTSFYVKIPGGDGLTTPIRELHNIISQAPLTSATHRKDFRKFVNISQRLHQDLLSEGLDKLPTNIQQLIIIPDGILHDLPFEILLDQPVSQADSSFTFKNLPYLFTAFDISYDYSASLRLANTQVFPSRERRSSFVGFAPSFKSATAASGRNCLESELYGLQCSANEVLQINQMLDGKVYTGQLATKEVFKSELLNNQIVHLATHACIDPNEHQLNKIYFSNEEYITQQELNALMIDAELSVLSACNTGKGEMITGEGVMSLARSFIMAGSKSILTSLWSVDDCTTSSIMISYYEQLKAGLNKDEALTHAKRSHLATADLAESHPYYWAAFVQFGNTNPLPSENRNYWIILAIALSFGLFLMIKRFY